MKKQKNGLFKIFATIIMLAYVFFYFFENPEHYSSESQYELYKMYFQFGKWLNGSIGIIFQLLPLIFAMFYIDKKNCKEERIFNALVLGAISLKPLHIFLDSYSIGSATLIVATVVAIGLNLANKTSLTVPIVSILFILYCASTIQDIMFYEKHVWIAYPIAFMMGTVYLCTYALIFIALLLKNRAHATAKICSIDIVADEGLSTKQKLLALKRMYEEGKITEEEYNEKRSEIIAKI